MESGAFGYSVLLLLGADERKDPVFRFGYIALIRQSFLNKLCRYKKGWPEDPGLRTLELPD
jgi:hypothetical protein